jgi:hypothetical protein
MSAPVTCPQDVLDLLPWYPEGALGDAERGRVEAHAAQCESCRSELAWIEGSAEPEAGAVPDRERLWARTLARIAAGDRSRVLLATPARRTRSWPIGLAAAASLLIALAAGLWAGLRARNVDDGSESFQVAAPPAGRSDGRELDVVFHPDASAQSIGAARGELEAAIVSGPSPVSGIYRVRLPADADPVRAAQQLRAGVASFAEPLPQ